MGMQPSFEFALMPRLAPRSMADAVCHYSSPGSMQHNLQDHQLERMRHRGQPLSSRRDALATERPMKVRRLRKTSTHAQSMGRVQTGPQPPLPASPRGGSFVERVDGRSGAFVLDGAGPAVWHGIRQTMAPLSTQAVQRWRDELFWIDEWGVGGSDGFYSPPECS